jgi:hypothetical protein
MTVLGNVIEAPIRVRGMSRKDEGARLGVLARSQRLVSIWYGPIEILTATAAIYIAVVFCVSAAGKTLADMLRRRFGLGAA